MHTPAIVRPPPNTRSAATVIRRHFAGSEWVDKRIGVLSGDEALSRQEILAEEPTEIRDASPSFGELDASVDDLDCPGTLLFCQPDVGQMVLFDVFFRENLVKRRLLYPPSPLLKLFQQIERQRAIDDGRQRYGEGVTGQKPDHAQLRLFMMPQRREGMRPEQDRGRRNRCNGSVRYRAVQQDVDLEESYMAPVNAHQHNEKDKCGENRFERLHFGARTVQ